MKINHLASKKWKVFIMSEEIKKEMDNKKKSFKERLDDILYLKKEDSSLIMKISRYDINNYQYEIISNNNFPVFNKEFEPILKKLKQVGEIELKEYPDKKETFSYFKEIHFDLDIFGLKRLTKYLVGDMR